jgi:A/G-specific adenine glycosylase
VSPWAILVSEVMLQQTPVTRVLPAYTAWLARWPTPATLANESPGEAVRQWERLGYPRRALRLHAAATQITERHQGRVPLSVADLRALPGVGDYTAAAVSSFAYQQRHAVVDTNVRRVLARAIGGEARPAHTPTSLDRQRAEELLPADPATAARWAVAVMELGALVCTARTAHCDRCPIADRCRWRALGNPDHPEPKRRNPKFAGSDRQVRGLLLAEARKHREPMDRALMDEVCPDPAQRNRALRGLLADGLLVETSDGQLTLPI